AKPQWGTMFRATWSGDSLYIGIVCKERDTKNLNIKTRAPRSPAVWDGDNIEILLETQTHDYYQIAVNPAGSISEADRQLGINTDWISGAQVATYIGEGYWSVEICIPVAGEAAASIDPLKGIAGKKPSATYPWYINVCRMRITADEKELTAFSPTGKPNFHDSLKFGILWSP
ncbi:MAG: carbohydrate-binding family 9-like protein, partial [Lentisphaerota bacterium]